MRLLRCNAGHYYDADTFGSCPHCDEGDLSATVESVTIASRPSPDVTVASATNTGWGRVPQNYDPSVTIPLDAGKETDNDATVGVYVRKEAVIQPVAGWLVCVKGPSMGKDYRIISGRNSIGRDGSNPISISEDRGISRSKHAIVTYDPHSNSFFVQPGESSEMCYLNNKVVLDAVPMSADDILTVGNSYLLFVPCCTERFSWNLLKNGGESDD